ncbi:MAG: hypothetical protein WA303_21995, partial [Bradyrhizobium sp.]
PSSLRGAIATKQSTPPFAVIWIASRSLSSGAHSRDPLARNDGMEREPGIHTQDGGYGFRARAKRARPGMTRDEPGHDDVDGSPITANGRWYKSLYCCGKPWLGN